MAAVPQLSPEWPPTAGQLAMLATTAHWKLEELAWKLPRHEASHEQLEEVAHALLALADLLQKHVPDTAEKPHRKEVRSVGNSNGGGGPHEVRSTVRPAVPVEGESHTAPEPGASTDTSDGDTSSVDITK